MLQRNIRPQYACINDGHATLSFALIVVRFNYKVKILVTIVRHLSLAIFPLFFAFRIALKNHSSSEPRHEYSLVLIYFL